MTTNQNKTEFQDKTKTTMKREDSGISTTSSTLRLSSAMESSTPIVRMPNEPTSKTTSQISGINNSMQDSGVCSDLMMRLSLSSDTSSRLQQPHPNETWREYFEPDEDGDVQLHLGNKGAVSHHVGLKAVSCTLRRGVGH